MSSLLAVVGRLPSRAAPQTIKTTKYANNIQNMRTDHLPMGPEDECGIPPLRPFSYSVRPAP